MEKRQTAKPKPAKKTIARRTTATTPGGKANPAGRTSDGKQHDVEVKQDDSIKTVAA